MAKPGVTPQKRGSNALSTNAQPVLLARTIRDLTADLQRNGFPAYRAKQIFHWLYKHAVDTPEAMQNLPAQLRQWLGDHYRFGGGTIVDERHSADGSAKYLVRLYDGECIESVLMPDGDRRSLCVSSQVGCALGCLFCLTGKGGYRRHCGVDQIVGQYLAVRRRPECVDNPITHIVFMGMGEPLLNCDAVIAAIRRLIDPQAVGLSPRRITVSTVGVVEGIRKLGEAGLNIKLAVSLNAATNSLRSEIMPWNRKDNLDDLLDACRRFPLPRRHRITFEYVLIRGVNDSLDDARRLAKLLRGIQCKINVIPFNPVRDELPYERPDDATVAAFQQLLLDQNYTVSVRYSKAADVFAACGQLAGHVRRAGNPIYD